MTIRETFLANGYAGFGFCEVYAVHPDMLRPKNGAVIYCYEDHVLVCSLAPSGNQDAFKVLHSTIHRFAGFDEFNSWLMTNGELPEPASPFYNNSCD